MTSEMTMRGIVRQRVRGRLTRRKLTCLPVALLLMFLGSACQTAQGLVWVKLVLSLILQPGRLRARAMDDQGNSQPETAPFNEQG